MKACLALLLGCAIMVGNFSNGNDIELPGDIPDLSELSIIKVLNTTERLWFYQTSYSTNYTGIYDCIYNIKINISTKEYNFTQTFRDYLSVERNVSLTGIFVKRDHGKPPLSMLVKNPYNVTKQHTLVFSDDKGCSVFYMDLYDNTIAKETPICEMYLTDARVEKGPETSCKEFYRNKCKTSRMLYRKQCRLSVTAPPTDDSMNEINYDDYTPSPDWNEIGLS